MLAFILSCVNSSSDTTVVTSFCPTSTDIFKADALNECIAFIWGLLLHYYNDFFEETNLPPLWPSI